MSEDINETTSVPVVNKAVLRARKQWFETYCSRIECTVQQSQRAAHSYCCPCCGYPMLSERGGYEICALCDWEDDGQDDPDADEVWGGPNGVYSLTLARDNFKRYWKMYPLNDHRSGNSRLELEAKQTIAAAFDAMLEANERERNRLMEIILTGEKTLRKELKKRVKEIETNGWKRYQP